MRQARMEGNGSERSLSGFILAACTPNGSNEEEARSHEVEKFFVFHTAPYYFHGQSTKGVLRKCYAENNKC